MFTGGVVEEGAKVTQAFSGFPLLKVHHSEHVANIMLPDHFRCGQRSVEVTQIQCVLAGRVTTAQSFCSAFEN
jgi:hypothetical protein